MKSSEATLKAKQATLAKAQATLAKTKASYNQEQAKIAQAKAEQAQAHAQGSQSHVTGTNGTNNATTNSAKATNVANTNATTGASANGTHDVTKTSNSANTQQTINHSQVLTSDLGNVVVLRNSQAQTKPVKNTTASVVLPQAQAMTASQAHSANNNVVQADTVNANLAHKAKKPNQNTLPETSDQSSNEVGLIATMFAGILGLFGLGYKRKH